MEKFEMLDRYQIEVKRFYIPHSIPFKCPKCESDVDLLKHDDYMSYPTLNKFESVGGCCCECNTEFELDVKISMSIEYDLDKLKVK